MGGHQDGVEEWMRWGEVGKGGVGATHAAMLSVCTSDWQGTPRPTHEIDAHTRAPMHTSLCKTGETWERLMDCPCPRDTILWFCKSLEGKLVKVFSQFACIIS